MGTARQKMIEYMIVKFLAKSKTFKGIRYNTNKVDKNKGELMKVSGFGPLQGISNLKPQDYVNYLTWISARNKRVQYPQLHTIISAKGKSTGKEELTAIASAWLDKMGYGKQPYLIVFHGDTNNHHVHIVSTRIDKASGKKINSAFEKIRAMTAINQVMKQDEKLTAKTDLEKALAFNFSTKPQFMMILESKGYTLIEEHGKFELIKFGRKLLEIDVSEIKKRISNYQSPEKRAKQITALLYEYRSTYSGVLRAESLPLPGGGFKEKHGYTSDLAIFMKEKFGIHLIFHGVQGMPAYGYTVLDYSQGNVFKGGELMDLDVLTQEMDLALQYPLPQRSDLTRNILFKPYEQIDELMPLAFNGSFSPQETFIPYEAPIDINISDDIDDEAILGRNRHGKRKARTNTR